MSFLRRLATVSALLLSLVALVVWGVGLGHFAGDDAAHAVRPLPRPPASVAAEAARNRGPEKQVLFGDLHVHTTFSSDAFLFSLPLAQGEGAHPPADACDFARFCSQLDFWAITDHAELITPEQWRITKNAIRQCNAVAGSADDPDMVSFLGWEWTQVGKTPADHYGHKNVIFPDIEEERVPARPIGVDHSGLAEAIFALPLPLRTVLPLFDPAGLTSYLRFNRFVRQAAEAPVCPRGVDVRSLPADCLEYASTPAELFAKLDQWGFEALVIPHGTSWGLDTPADAEFASQLPQHDADRQRLIEVFSGHGNSDVHRPWRGVERASDGSAVCPPPRAGFTACCWQAGELIRRRCGTIDAASCETRVERARREFLAAGVHPLRFHMVSGATAADWADCDQLNDDFLPAYSYRPGMSTQAALAAAGSRGERFRFGLVASSDNHTARPGTGYKQYDREVMTDTWGLHQDLIDLATDDLPQEDEIVPIDVLEERVSPLQPLQPERGASFYYTGGLAAVHAEGRDRASIFKALERREVYATSGQRMLLWFDLLLPDGTTRPMGSEVTWSGTPRFRVRAAGAFEQLPGCPDDSVTGLGQARLARLCRGECFHPGERRKRIDRIEVIRIRPNPNPAVPIADRIEDPWRVFACPEDGDGCSIEFDDPEFAATPRETVYYVRVLQEAEPLINGDPLRCERDAQGRCLQARPCFASGPRDVEDDCLSPAQPRAWSSPIFLDPA